MSAQFVGPEMTDAAEIQEDVIIRLDLDDEVSRDRYPDGVRWSFSNPRLLGKRFVIQDHHVIEVTDVHGTSDGAAYWATRRRE
jgi:hypothetical protein